MLRPALLDFAIIGCTARAKNHPVSPCCPTVVPPGPNPGYLINHPHFDYPDIFTILEERPVSGSLGYREEEDVVRGVSEVLLANLLWRKRAAG